jgi:hypothetical protein
MHTEEVHKYYYVDFRRHQLRRVLRLLVVRPQWLHDNLAVRRDYSAPAAQALRQPRRAP